MNRGLQGRYVTTSTSGEVVQAFVPAPLPPSPAVVWTPDLHSRFDEALLALGRLDGVTQALPETSLFLYTYVRKEALLSSMIEGTQSSLSDLLLFEMDQAPAVPLEDVAEVSNYVAALNHGLKRLAEGFPLSLRLIREIHRILLSRGRGSDRTPGEFRRTQNWIGGTRPGNAAFVPPPPSELPDCVARLELFLHDQPEPTPVLLKAALAHVQFETIHPFLDGNGRLGRLLITLLLCEGKVLRQPMLYLSLYFKMHRQAYYEALNNVRLAGDWEAWLDFFTEAVIVTAAEAVDAARQLLDIAAEDRQKIGRLRRAAASPLIVHGALLEHPVATSGWLVNKTGLSAPTVNKSLAVLVRVGVIRELTGRRRGRIFIYQRCLDILNRGTELP